MKSESNCDGQHKGFSGVILVLYDFLIGIDSPPPRIGFQLCSNVDLLQGNLHKWSSARGRCLKTLVFEEQLGDPGLIGWRKELLSLNTAGLRLFSEFFQRSEWSTMGICSGGLFSLVYRSAWPPRPPPTSTRGDVPPRAGMKPLSL